MDLWTGAQAAGLTDALYSSLKEEEKKAIGKIIEKMVKAVKGGTDKLSLIFGEDGEKYIWSMYAKCSTVKTILNRNSPIKISDCFIAPDFSFRNEKGVLSELSLDEFLSDIVGGNSINIITGLAGCGKSILLKYMFNQIIIRGYSKFPIFFEFRDLYKNLSLEDNILFHAICENINRKVKSFNQNKMRIGLESGSFYLLLDGFDEVPLSKREKIHDEIMLFSEKYQSCPLVITSRPSRDFISWSGFREMNVKKFDKIKTISYINKIPFDSDKKEYFVNEVRKMPYSDSGPSFYEQNKDFLCNPLLTSMMLLVYDKKNEIPKNKYDFYSKCYDVLSEEHDSLKGSYKRELHSPINIDDISYIFMYFCVLSYKNSAFSFSREKCLDYINKSTAKFSTESGKTGIQSQLILKDFCESLSILQEDGVHYEFIHRSFQEYFYAKFAFQNKNVEMYKVIASVLFHSEYNNVLSLIDAVNHRQYEKEFIAVIMDHIIDKLKEVKSKKEYVLVFFDEIVSIFGICGDDVFDESYSPDYYYDLSSVKSTEKAGLSRIYVNIIMEYIKKYYGGIYSAYNHELYSCMNVFSKFNFNILGGEKKKIMYISELHLENSKIYAYCEIIYKIIFEARDRIRELNRGIDDGWGEEFSFGV